MKKDTRSGCAENWGLFIAAHPPLGTANYWVLVEHHKKRQAKVIRKAGQGHTSEEERLQSHILGLT